jgi:hypothetical protein
MGKQVPSVESVKSAGKRGGIDGGTLAAGEILGRALMGGGPGTALGSVLAAASESNQQRRDTMATIGIERAANELVGV